MNQSNLQEVKQIIASSQTAEWIAYRKKDGELRFALATTNSQLIPAGDEPKGIAVEHDLVTRYFDMEAKGWRSFINANLEWSETYGFADGIDHETVAEINNFVMSDRYMDTFTQLQEA